jgi:Fis family transcriptional regulator
MTRTSSARTATARGPRTPARKTATHDMRLNEKRLKHRPLRDFAEEALQKYFRDLNGHRPGDLYDLVLGEVEEPLFKTVMEHTQGNQSVAAAILGINRATLRKKLRQYQLVN